MAGLDRRGSIGTESKLYVLCNFNSSIDELFIENIICENCDDPSSDVPDLPTRWIFVRNGLVNGKSCAVSPDTRRRAREHGDVRVEFSRGIDGMTTTMDKENFNWDGFGQVRLAASRPGISSPRAA